MTEIDVLTAIGGVCSKAARQPIIVVKNFNF